FAMQACVVRIPIRGHSGQAIERAAQDDNHQARRASGVGKQCIGDRGSRRQRTRADQKAASTAVRWRRPRHDYLRWNSGLINNNATACPEVAARRKALKVSGRAYAPKLAAARSAGSTPL